MRHYFWLLAFAALLTVSTGCGNKSAEVSDKEPDVPEWLADDSQRDEEESDEELLNTTANTVADETEAQPRGRKTSRSGKLELKLQPGDRFPLRKVIDVELTQSGLDGQPEVSRRRLDMMLMITAGERVDDMTRLQVRYERISYLRDVAGDHLEYDSRQPPTDVPLAVRMYHDMVKDGFSFWIDKENKIANADDFKAFLTRCLRNIPEDKRQQVVFEAEGSTGENGIADFIDNSIGLLPFGYHKPGDSWEKTRSIARPIPMVVKNTYVLKQLDTDAATIGISGMIAPSTTSMETSANSDMRISVVGGRADGTCSVFRDTGLPKESRVEQVVEMVVKTGQVQFGQQQKTVTTIESFPTPGMSAARVVNASHETAQVEEIDEQPRPRAHRHGSLRPKREVRATEELDDPDEE